MSAVKRRCINVLTAMSLLLCVAVCVVWVWSYRRQWQLTRAPAGATLMQFTSRPGRLVISIVDDWPDDRTSFATTSPSSFAGPVFAAATGTRKRFLGIALRTGDVSVAMHNGRTVVHQELGKLPLGPLRTWPTRRSVELAIPFPFLLLLTACYPTAGLVSRYVRNQRARRRMQACRCLACGYDLRATPDRCPECGTAVTPMA